MRLHELVKHQGADMPARFYVDGVRVRREQYEYLESIATHSDTFHTKARGLPGGKIRRTNYKTIRI